MTSFTLLLVTWSLKLFFQVLFFSCFSGGRLALSGIVANSCSPWMWRKEEWWGGGTVLHKIFKMDCWWLAMALALWFYLFSSFRTFSGLFGSMSTWPIAAWSAGLPAAGDPAFLHSGDIQLHYLHARWVSEETPDWEWLSSTFARPSLPISLRFSHHNEANVQPRGLLTARLRASCKLYDGETIVCFAHRGNEVVLGRALLLTLIYDELLMINRVGDCI